MPDDALAEHIRKIVDACPPLTSVQRNRIAALFRPTGAAAPYVPPRVKVHYDADGRVLFVGPASTDLLRHVELRYVSRTEAYEEAEAQSLSQAAVFETLSAAAVEYLVARRDLNWVMPVQHLGRNAEAIPQVKPERYWS